MQDRRFTVLSSGARRYYSRGKRNTHSCTNKFYGAIAEAGHRSAHTAVGRPGGVVVVVVRNRFVSAAPGSCGLSDGSERELLREA